MHVDQRIVTSRSSRGIRYLAREGVGSSSREAVKSRGERGVRWIDAHCAACSISKATQKRPGLHRAFPIRGIATKRFLDQRRVGMNCSKGLALPLARSAYIEPRRVICCI